MHLILTVFMALLQFFPLFGPGNAVQTGQALAEHASYHVYALDKAQSSVAIAIPLDEAPFLQLYSPAVLREFSRAALERQKQEIPADAQNVTFILMDQRRLAGETELHLIGYLVTTLAGGPDGPLNAYHEQFRVIDLNVDENRMPKGLIQFVGWMIA